MTPFRRYTNLAATIHLLRTQALTLLNPATWDDKNDAYFMAEYKRQRQARAVLALCFAECQETYHHWRVFSHGADGVCIAFDKDELLSAFADDPRVKTGYVKYKMIKELKTLRPRVDRLPFLKRFPYQDEREYRIVFVDTERDAEYQDYPIKLDWIERITLSPWMSKGLADSVRATLRSIKGCSGLSVARSTLVDNDAWKKFTTRVRGRS